MSDQTSRRTLLGWATGAVGVAAVATLGAAPSAAAPPAAPPAVPRPVSLPPVAVRVPVHHVRDLLPGAPADAVALTIDDGPHPVWTPRVLALLRRHDVQATFSLIGRQAHAYPDLVRRIAAEGHGICNHSMNHPQPFATRSAAVVRREITDTQDAIAAASGVTPTLFRAPGGGFSPTALSTVATLGMTPLAWDVDPRDWTRPGTAAVTARLLAARPGDVLLCHDGGGDRAQTVAALATVLPKLTGRGLRFVTL
jgi:peptidoglycan/xylan/chitin deacetylase (PgdA/CDA1 family)